MKIEQNGKALVSVWIPAYYAGDYMRETLESVLMQETEYPYEIVIGDDCSGDNTWDIICEYAEKYPDIIRAVRNEHNLGLTKNILATKMRCRGKYIVNLSGDDYWIDKKKIQKQADFLETHPEYAGVGTKVELRYDDSKVAFSTMPAQKICGCDYTCASYSKGINIAAHGLMVRNIFADPENASIIEKIYGVSSAIDDLYDPVLFLQFGKLFVMDEATCVYRIASVSKKKHNFNNERRNLEKAKIILDGYVNLEALQLRDISLHQRFCGTWNLAVLSSILLGDFKDLRPLYKQIPKRYRKPWYKSVGAKCLFTIWVSGYRYLVSHLKRRMKKQAK